MSTNLGRITIGGVLAMLSDSNPSTGGGLPAPVGSFVLCSNGDGIFYKNSASDTSWLNSSMPLSSVAAGSIIGYNTLNTPTAITSASGNKGLINDGGAISWSTVTGTGAPVRATSPVLVTPTLGVATATSINKVAITEPATSATLTLANGTTTSVTGGGTIALGGFTATIPATGTVTLGSPTASGNVFVGTSATTGAGNASLTYTSNTLLNSISTNGNVITSVANSNAGSLARTFILYSSVIASTYHKWSIGGSTVANLVATMDSTGFSLDLVGMGFKIKEGTNAAMGLATLVGGTLVVNTTKVTANSRIFLTGQGGNVANLGTYNVTARTAGTSFTITSSNVLDTNTVAWQIVEPL